MLNGSRLGILVAVCLSPAILTATPYQLVKVAGDADGLYSFGKSPAVNGKGQVAFSALKNGQQWLFLGDGTTTTAVSTVSSIPDADVAINDAGQVAFYLNSPVWGNGVCRWSDGSVQTIASPTDFTASHWGPAISANGTVAFYGTSRATGKQGIYAGSGGPVATIVDTAGPFSEIGYSPAINSSGTVAFSAKDRATGQWGVYKISGGVLTTVADTSGPISPSGFPSLTGVTINDAGQVAFEATLDSGGYAIFRGDGTTLDRIVDTSGPFAYFQDQPVINSAGAVGFFGVGSGAASGLYTGPDPVADKVFASTDMLDGAAVSVLTSQGWAFGNNGWATFSAMTQSGSVVRESIYAARPLLFGDANRDGKVDIDDLTRVLTNYDKSGMAWDQGDFDGNGSVEMSDLGKVLTNYNHTAGSFAASTKAVPEPSSLALLVLGTIGLCGGLFGEVGHRRLSLRERTCFRGAKCVMRAYR